MAVMPKNLLQLYAMRSRWHERQDATVLASPLATLRKEWGQEVIATIDVRGDSKHLPVYLSQGDVNAIVTALFRVVGQEVQRQLAEAFLKTLDGNAVMDLIVRVHTQRPPQR